MGLVDERMEKLCRVVFPAEEDSNFSDQGDAIWHLCLNIMSQLSAAVEPAGQNDRSSVGVKGGYNTRRW